MKFDSTTLSIFVSAVFMVCAGGALQAQTARQTMTLSIPVSIQSAMTGVTFDVWCNVYNQDKGEGSLGTGGYTIGEPVGGNFDGTISLIVYTFPDKTLAAAHSYTCRLHMRKGQELMGTSNPIVAQAATGGVDDWKYAKPGTTLVAILDEVITAN